MLKVNKKFINRFNKAVAAAEAFVFLIDFEGKKPILFKRDEAATKDLWFQTPEYGNNAVETMRLPNYAGIKSKPVSIDYYQKAFDLVQKHLKNGDTYLLNLTMPSRIETDLTLKQIYHKAQAPYKILFRDEFVCYTPESFIKTEGDKIFTYPMKGTINAAIPNAENHLLSDKKETYEHHTIVDLLRNDLAQVATGIEVRKFKYIDVIQTNTGKLLQMSSEISGVLPSGWRKHAAEMFLKLLPAGSVSGAPKKKTLEIIQSAEKTDRGYYTGIFGYYDGHNFDTAVLIRFIEKKGARLYYHSGGGITALSRLTDEYQELKQKIYVPIN